MIIFISGCGINQEEQLYSKDEAERKFVQICRDEYDWNVNTKYIGNTLWIYLPYEQDIFKFKANPFPQRSKFAVAYLSGDFAEEKFYFEYHIVPLLKSEEDRGYTSSFTQQVAEDFQHLLNVIYRVYFNAEGEPEFYIVVMADIVNGMEVVYTIYNQDLKKIYNNAVAPEECCKRILQDTEGNSTIIQDKTGRHLTYQEINFGQFLARQIVQRIRYRFPSEGSQSRETTEEGIQDEILKIIFYCLRTYEFKDFLSVILKDLSTGAKINLTPSALEKLKEF
jgi:hypothetical protein